jgi:hypothetical protein
MAEDASLDDFLSGTDEETDESESAVDGAASETDDSDGAAAGTPEPATTTYAWDGDGATCESCGDVAEERWQQDGTLVCADCKDWDG